MCYGKLGKHYGWELSLFKRFLSHGVLFSFGADVTTKGDHSPRASVILIIHDFVIFEVAVYNIHHEEEL